MLKGQSTQKQTMRQIVCISTQVKKKFTVSNLHSCYPDLITAVVNIILFEDLANTL